MVIKKTGQNKQIKPSKTFPLLLFIVTAFVILVLIFILFNLLSAGYDFTQVTIFAAGVLLLISIYFTVLNRWLTMLKMENGPTDEHENSNRSCKIINNKGVSTVCEQCLWPALYSVKDLLYVIDYEGRVLDAFPQNNELLIRPADQMIGKTIHEFLPTEEANKLLNIVRRVLNRLDVDEFDVPLKINHEIVWFACRAVKLEVRDKDCVMILMKDITERKKGELAISALAEGISHNVDNDFFRILVKNIALALNADFAFITEYNPAKSKKVKTLAFWSKDRYLDNFEYGLEGTPCEVALKGQKVCYYPKDVQKYFPEDRGLAEFKVESFLGLPLYDTNRKILGHMAIMDTKSIKKNYTALPILQIFSTRASAEIERNLTIEKLQNSQKQLDEAQQIAHLGSWEWNLKTNEVYWSEEFFKICGLDRKLIKPSLIKYLECLAPKDRWGFKKVIVKAKKMGGVFKYSHRMRVNNINKQVDGTVRFHKEGLNDSDKIIGIVTDVTEKIKSEEVVRNSLIEKEVLLRELNHRVKNNLQVISSIFDLESDSIGDENVKRIMQENQRRIKAISIVHNLLYNAEDIARINFGIYIKELIAELIRVFNVSEERIKVQFDVKDALLDVVEAVPCGLIINEIFTNILKHAYPDGRSGIVDISFLINDGHVTLRIKDDGVGLPEHLEYKDLGSLGMKLVDALKFQLDAEIKFVSSLGTDFQLDFNQKGVK